MPGRSVLVNVAVSNWRGGGGGGGGGGGASETASSL